jgi:hypothetical protein
LFNRELISGEIDSFVDGFRKRVGRVVEGVRGDKKGQGER